MNGLRVAFILTIICVIIGFVGYALMHPEYLTAYCVGEVLLTCGIIGAIVFGSLTLAELMV